MGIFRLEGRYDDVQVDSVIRQCKAVHSVKCVVQLHDPQHEIFGEVSRVGNDVFIRFEISMRKPAQEYLCRSGVTRKSHGQQEHSQGIIDPHAMEVEPVGERAHESVIA